ncbi:peptidoglycan-binding protein [Streptomyces sp. NPDC057654]|uniref:peptidoglycan-binding domain-containing protein n=1 Tax=Streptomyces sp. NPDC057654 TaxID=3346196 RepID=UPI00367FC031
MTGEICPRCSAPPRTDGAPSCRCDALAAEREAAIAASEDFDPLRLRPYVALGDAPADHAGGRLPPPPVRLAGDLLPSGSPILSGEPLFGKGPAFGGGRGGGGGGSGMAPLAGYGPPPAAPEPEAELLPGGPPPLPLMRPGAYTPAPSAPSAPRPRVCARPPEPPEPPAPPAGSSRIGPLPELGRNGPAAPPHGNPSSPTGNRPPHGPPPRHRRRRRPTATIVTLTTGAAAAVACAVAISTGLLGGDRGDGGDGGDRALARNRTSAPPPEGMPDGDPAQAPEPAPVSAAPPPSFPAAPPQAQAPAARTSRAAPPARTAIPHFPGPATGGPAAPSPFRSTPPQPRPPAVRVLREGMRGADVADLQRRLEQTGIWYEGGTDGYFGADERRAVADYQRAKTITTDPSGVYGPRTRHALEAETDGP